MTRYARSLLTLLPEAMEMAARKGASFKFWKSRAWMKQVHGLQTP